MFLFTSPQSKQEGKGTVLHRQGAQLCHTPTPLTEKLRHFYQAKTLPYSHTLQKPVSIWDHGSVLSVYTVLTGFGGGGSDRCDPDYTVDGSLEEKPLCWPKRELTVDNLTKAVIIKDGKSTDTNNEQPEAGSQRWHIVPAALKGSVCKDNPS